MPIDLSHFLDARRCAVLVFECQENVIGAGSRLPGLVAAVRDGAVLKNASRLLASARRAGAGVFYCTAVPREGGLGRAKTPLLDRMERATAPTGDAADASVVSEIAPEIGDVVIARSHGMSGFYDTGLDPCLRDRGAETVILIGVSLNIGLVGTAIEAVNRGYRVIVPRDCVAADPPEYGEQMLRYTFRNLAYLSASTEIEEIWDS